MAAKAQGTQRGGRFATEGTSLAVRVLYQKCVHLSMHSSGAAVGRSRAGRLNAWCSDGGLSVTELQQ
jgi:hypothetical protein